MSEAREGEYKGSPVLILSNGPEDKFPFTFGVRKAKLILEHFDDVKKFVEKHSTPE